MRGDLRRRSLVKTLTWRAVAFCITVGVSYALTRNPLLAAAIGGIADGTKTFVYYFHERLWARRPDVLNAPPEGATGPREPGVKERAG